MAWAGIPNGLQALIVIPGAGPPTLSPLLLQASVSCLPCCTEPDSTELGRRSGRNKKWKLLPRKVSEELTSDGWRRQYGGGTGGGGRRGAK